MQRSGSIPPVMVDTSSEQQYDREVTHGDYAAMAIGANDVKVHPCAVMFAATTTPGRYFIRYAHRVTHSMGRCTVCGENVLANAMLRPEMRAAEIMRRTDA